MPNILENHTVSEPLASATAAESPRRGVAHTADGPPAGSEAPAFSSPANTSEALTLARGPGGDEVHTANPGPSLVASPIVALPLPPLSADYRELLDVMERGRRDIERLTGIAGDPNAVVTLAAIRNAPLDTFGIRRVDVLKAAAGAALAHDPNVHWEPWAPETRPSRLRRITAHLRDWILDVAADVAADDAGARAPGRS